MKRVFSALGGILGRGSKSQVLSQAAFLDQFVELLREAAPQFEIQKTGELQLLLKDSKGNESRVFLDNAYTDYAREPASKDELVQRYLGSLLEQTQSDDTIDPSRIVPVIKDRKWLSEVKASAPSMANNVFDEYNEELLIVYAVDSPRNIRYLTSENLGALNIDRTVLRETAVRNLRALLPEVQEHRGPLVSLITAGADYVSSLLLFDHLWTGTSIKVDGEFVVAIPSRDVLLVSGSRNKAGIEKLRQMSEKAVKESSYSLTATLFVYREGQFRAFVDEDFPSRRLQ
jgi:uncharacterized protein YtpQ (UPF0354 family)